MTDNPYDRNVSQRAFSGALHCGYPDKRLPPFTEGQLAQLRDFQIGLLEAAHSIPCTLTIEHGHMSASAVFTLDAPEGSPDKNIRITLAEAKEGDFGYSYTMYTTVDDVPRGTLPLTRFTRVRDIPEYALNSLRKKILEMNARDFNAMEQIVRDPKVAHLNGWQRRPF